MGNSTLYLGEIRLSRRSLLATGVTSQIGAPPNREVRRRGLVEKHGASLSAYSREIAAGVHERVAFGVSRDCCCDRRNDPTNDQNRRGRRSSPCRGCRSSPCHGRRSS